MVWKHIVASDLYGYETPKSKLVRSDSLKSGANAKMSLCPKPSVALIQDVSNFLMIHSVHILIPIHLGLAGSISPAVWEKKNKQKLFGNFIAIAHKTTPTKTTVAWLLDRDAEQ